MADLLELCQVTRRFGGLTAVDDLSFGVGVSEIVGLIGPNGAGKTTTVNLISGAISPTAGTVLFGGKDITELPTYRRVRLGLVRTFQSTTIYPDRTVRENAYRGSFIHSYPGAIPAFFSTKKARDRRDVCLQDIDALLTDLGLEKYASVVAGTLPYGFQKMLGIVIGLAARPKLILLDEPAAGLSGEEANTVLQLIRRIREGGISVVVIDHNMRFISQLCDRLIVTSQGRKIAEGVPKEVLTDEAVVTAYLGGTHA